MPARVTEEELYAALDDALTLASEFQGASLEMKLAAFGLDSEDVRRLLQDRAETVAPTDRAAFAQGFGEGLIAGVALSRRARAEEA